MIEVIRLSSQQVPWFVTNLVRQGRVLSTDPSSVNQDDIFLSIPPLNTTMRHEIKNIEHALTRGVSKIVTQEMANNVIKEHEIFFPSLSSWIKVDNTRSFYAHYAKALFPNSPSLLVGVTGTNGKSSTVDFVRQIWSFFGYKAASIGTLGVKVQENLTTTGYQQFMNSSLTTPDALNLHELLDTLKKIGTERVCLEASSHGLSLRRMDATNLKVASFTGLSHDHLDFHRNYRNYFEAKTRIFTDLLAEDGIAVLNSDDKQSEILFKICRERKIKTILYGKHGNEVIQNDLLTTESGFTATWDILGKRHKVKVPLFGKVQCRNITAAIAIIIACGDSTDQIARAISSLSTVPGRMELVGYHPLNGAQVFVDYAHNPEAFECVLASVRSYTKKFLTVVFGCGGNRDKTKRAMMGKIAGQLADFIFVTDDNPRGENPSKIRKEILRSCPRAIEVSNRQEAIKQAIKNLGPGDSCLIAGKGHEITQIVGDEIIMLDDREIVARIFSSWT